MGSQGKGENRLAEEELEKDGIRDNKWMLEDKNL